MSIPDVDGLNHQYITNHEYERLKSGDLKTVAKSTVIGALRTKTSCRFMGIKIKLFRSQNKFCFGSSLQPSLRHIYIRIRLLKCTVNFMKKDVVNAILPCLIYGLTRFNGYIHAIEQQCTLCPRASL